MSLSKILAGVAAFAVALGAAVLLTRYYSAPDAPRPAPTAPSPVPTVETAPAPAAAAAAPKAVVSSKTEMVTLDLAAGKSHTALLIERDLALPAPEKVWVRTYFFSTEAPGRVWSGEAVELRQPFGTARRASVSATADCGWCRDAGAPRAGYYARVEVSSQSKEATRLSDERVDTSITTAAPVVVQEGAGRR